MALNENLPAPHETLHCDCKTDGARRRDCFGSVLRASRSMLTKLCKGFPQDILLKRAMIAVRSDRMVCAFKASRRSAIHGAWAASSQAQNALWPPPDVKLSRRATLRSSSEIKFSSLMGSQKHHDRAPNLPHPQPFGFPIHPATLAGRAWPLFRVARSRGRPFTSAHHA